MKLRVACIVSILLAVPVVMGKGLSGHAKGEGRRGGVGGLCPPQLPGTGAGRDRPGRAESVADRALFATRQSAHAGREDDRTIGQRHEQEQCRLLALPERPYENSKAIRVRISRYQTAQIDRNRYSVPTAHVGRWLWAHVGCDRVCLYAEQQRVAEHPRVFGNSKWQIDPLHYLELIHHRIAAFDSARPIRQWRSRWPAEYETLLEILRQRQGHNQGTRDLVRILLLHQQHPAARVEQAVREALACQSYSYPAVKHLLQVHNQPHWSAEPLAADCLPGVTDRQVAAADISRYDLLLAGGGQ